MMSACVKWAKEQVDTFNTILERQLSNIEHDNPIWTKCMNQAKDHAKMLSEVGLDFKSLVGRNLDSIQPQGSSVGLGLSS